MTDCYYCNKDKSLYLIQNEWAAGQSVRHAHFHLIPRYEGDVENPIGGVRNLFNPGA